MSEHQAVCPNCGHCPTCGRSGRWYYQYPWWYGRTFYPTPPYQVTWGSGETNVTVKYGASVTNDASAGTLALVGGCSA